jgi:hypothetical protein
MRGCEAVKVDPMTRLRAPSAGSLSHPLATVGGMADPLPFRWSQWTHPRALQRFHIAVDIFPDRGDAQATVRPLESREERTWTVPWVGDRRPPERELQRWEGWPPSLTVSTLCLVTRKKPEILTAEPGHAPPQEPHRDYVSPNVGAPGNSS